MAPCAPVPRNLLACASEALAGSCAVRRGFSGNGWEKSRLRDSGASGVPIRVNRETRRALLSAISISGRLGSGCPRTRGACLHRQCPLAATASPPVAGLMFSGRWAVYPRAPRKTLSTGRGEPLTTRNRHSEHILVLVPSHHGKWLNGLAPAPSFLKDGTPAKHP
jgi:hypothetical protein